MHQILKQISQPFIYPLSQAITHGLFLYFYHHPLLNQPYFNGFVCVLHYAKQPPFSAFISFPSSLYKLQEVMAAQIKGLKSMNKLGAGSRRLPMLVEKLPEKYGLSGSKKSKREGDDNGLRKVEARKSVSHVETNLNSVASFLQVKVLACDMPEFVQIHAFRCARRIFDSLEKFRGKHMAYNIKKEFDKVYGPAWHCVVGSDFGSFVTHSTGCFIYFSMEKLYILLFKTQIQKAVEYV